MEGRARNLLSEVIQLHDISMKRTRKNLEMNRSPCNESESTWSRKLLSLVTQVSQLSPVSLLSLVVSFSEQQTNSARCYSNQSAADNDHYKPAHDQYCSAGEKENFFSVPSGARLSRNTSRKLEIDSLNGPQTKRISNFVSTI